MSDLQKIFTTDGMSHYRFESDRRIRFVLMPEEKLILAGQLSMSNRTLVLFKSRMNTNRKSYTFAVPYELYTKLTDVKGFVISVKETNQFFYISRDTVSLYGVLSEARDVSKGGQIYLFLEQDKWTECPSLDMAVSSCEAI